jgi:hypothetical protein
MWRMGEPIWSRHFAGDIAKLFGFPMPETAPDGKDEGLRQEGARLVEEITEQFRYLPGEPTNWVFNFARFLRSEVEEGSGIRPYGWPVHKLREVLEYQSFLRQRHGTRQPADESDEWSEEDRRDFSLESLRRWDEDNPQAWPEDPAGAQRG